MGGIPFWSQSEKSCPPYMGSSAPCSPDFLEEFFSETEHIFIRCGESSRRRAGSRRIGHEGSRSFAMPRRRRLATCRPLVKPLEPLILISATCGGLASEAPQIIGVATY